MNKIKSTKKFSEILKETIGKYGGISKFAEEIEIDKKQLTRLLNSNGPKAIQERTVNKLQEYISLRPAEIAELYRKEFGIGVKSENKISSDKININLTKITKSKDLFDFFSNSQILETSFEAEPVNEDHTKALYNILNHVELTSKLLKNEWTFLDYYKFLPSSKFDFYAERQNESIAELSFHNETSKLIDKLKMYNNFIFINKFNRIYEVQVKKFNSKNKPFIESSSHRNFEILKIIISDSSKEKLLFNANTRIVESCSENNQPLIIKDIEEKAYGEKYVREEEIGEEAIEAWKEAEIDSYYEMMGEEMRGK